MTQVHGVAGGPRRDHPPGVPRLRLQDHDEAESRRDERGDDRPRGKRRRRRERRAAEDSRGEQVAERDAECEREQCHRRSGETGRAGGEVPLRELADGVREREAGQQHDDPGERRGERRVRADEAREPRRDEGRHERRERLVDARETASPLGHELEQPGDHAEERADGDLRRSAAEEARDPRGAESEGDDGDRRTVRGGRALDRLDLLERVARREGAVEHAGHDAVQSREAPEVRTGGREAEEVDLLRLRLAERAHDRRRRREELRVRQPEPTRDGVERVFEALRRGPRRVQRTREGEDEADGAAVGGLWVEHRGGGRRWKIRAASSACARSCPRPSRARRTRRMFAASVRRSRQPLRE